MTDPLNATWEADSRDEFSLVIDSDELCCIMRSYPQRLSSSGHSLYASDRTKPMEWTITRPGHHSQTLCAAGTSVREAKKIAEGLVAPSH